MTTEVRNVINWSKAVTRALKRWQKHPSTENQDTLLDRTYRLALSVEHLDKYEKTKKDSAKNFKDNVMQLRRGKS